MLRFVTVLLLSLTLAASPASAGSAKQALAESILDNQGAEAEFDAGFRSAFVPGFVQGLTSSGGLRVKPGMEAEFEALVLEWWIPRLAPVVDRMFVELRARSASRLVELVKPRDLKAWAAFEATHPTATLRATWAGSEVGQRVAAAQAALGLEMAGIAAELMTAHAGEFTALIGGAAPEFGLLLRSRGLVEGSTTTPEL